MLKHHADAGAKGAEIAFAIVHLAVSLITDALAMKNDTTAGRDFHEVDAAKQRALAGPLEPRSTTVSPVSTVMSMPLRTTRSPKLFCRLSILTISVMRPQSLLLMTRSST